jgi:hypothetical protein
MGFGSACAIGIVEREGGLPFEPVARPTGVLSGLVGKSTNRKISEGDFRLGESTK